ncbi:MAG TPA: ATP-binding protein [Chthoniobacterales bacterium]|nr:ATP-binding protein [Chthoniobacterales bacterium]
MPDPILNRERFPRELEILRQLADGLPQIVWVARPDGSHEYYNQRFYEYTGRGREIRMEDSWTDLFHPDDAKRADDAWTEALQSGTPYEIEFRLKRASDGAYRWFLGRALPYRDENGEIVNWFGTCTDVHALKTATDALRHAHEELRQESRQKDEFLGMISHELRTPLNAVFGWTRLMQENVLNENERVEAVNSIMRNAEAQGRLIEDVLDITRIVNQKLSLDRKIMNLDGIVSDAVEAVTPSANAKGVQLQTVIESRDILVHADPLRLQQALLNLMTNAVKFTPAGGDVVLGVAREGENAFITVADTGKGISPDLLPHIFERFRQGDSSSTRQYGGLGLGLTIAHQLVMMHHGEITAQSDGEGKGSRFTVRLPVVALDSRPPAEERHRTDEFVFPAESLRGLHVMVVDDDPGVRDVVALTLAKCGASVTVASSADDALNLLPNLSPDVVVSDLAMPYVDGYEFIRRFRALARPKDATVPVIALTAYGNLQDRDRALKAGFDKYLSKPIDPADLVRAIVRTREEKMPAAG